MPALNLPAPCSAIGRIRRWQLSSQEHVMLTTNSERFHALALTMRAQVPSIHHGLLRQRGLLASQLCRQHLNIARDVSLRLPISYSFSRTHFRSNPNPSVAPSPGYA